jgi:molecular chaperone GrpE
MSGKERDAIAGSPSPYDEEETIEIEVTGADTEDAAETSDEAVSEELGRLQIEINKLREMYLRKLADFDNYRKRQEREAEEFRRFANASLIRECLPVLDNLERALAAPSQDSGGVREGVELVLRQFKEVLGRFGVVEIDPQGQAFDPSIHEAIGRHESPDAEENTIVGVMQKGYLVGEKLLRPALVIVAVSPVTGSPAGEERS